MCFSPQADLVGGLVIGAIGIDVVRHVTDTRRQLALAALPLMFAGHQLDETLVWWALQGHIPMVIGQIATWAYVLFAFVVLPAYVPAAVLLFERSNRRRIAIAAFAILGLALSVLLFANMIDGNVSAKLGHRHIAYGVGIHSDFVIVGLYVITTCGALLFAGNRAIAVYGLVNVVAVAVLAHLTIDGFASLWCAWAAFSSAAIATFIRVRERR